MEVTNEDHNFLGCNIVYFIINPEEGDSTFLRDSDYTASHPLSPDLC
jgi:hypothetical protein